MDIVRTKSFRPRFLTGLIVFGLIASPLAGLLFPQSASALSGWKAGNIMDDYIMSKKSTMSISKIQSFLDDKVPSCDTKGQQLSEYGGPDLNHDGKVQRWEWGKANYNQTTFTCLKDYEENDKSAARIIYDAAQQYSINPQVLLVLLQKEQSLVKDTWPLKIQYRSATGYGCPDTAACDSQYYGLTNQINWSAKMFRAILDNSPTWYTPYELGKNYIQYNPDADCGGSTVNIENRATQALYNYTPYQPNKGALNAGWGTAPCGAYGNRNFFMYFTDWFGSTRVKFSNMEEPRWMKTKADVYKKIPGLPDENLDPVIPAGTELYFPKKVSIGGNLYLQTQYDADNGLGRGILSTDLDEITVNYIDMESPRWVKTTSDLRKTNPQTNQPTGDVVEKGTQLYIPKKVTIGGTTYFRTQYDTAHDISRGIPRGMTEDSTPAYKSFTQPRWMVAVRNTNVYDLRSGKSNPVTSLALDSISYFDTKVQLNGATYAINGMPAPGQYPGVPLDDLRDIVSDDIGQMDEGQRTYKVINNTRQKLDLSTGLIVSSSGVEANAPIFFQGSITLGGTTYMRTAYDTVRDYTTVIPLSNLTPISVSFIPMQTPRTMKVVKNTKKVDPVMLKGVDDTLLKGTRIAFTQKITINGKVYLRTKFDQNHNNYKVISLSSLKEI